MSAESLSKLLSRTVGQSYISQGSSIKGFEGFVYNNNSGGFGVLYRHM